jgi:type VI secretion system protein VasG
MNLRALVGKVNDTTRGVLEAAAGLCLARTHYDIEIEHFLLKMMDVPDGDFAAILKAFSVDKSRLAGEINRSLDKLKSGNARTPAFSPTLVDMIREGWVVGSLEFGAAEIRSGFTILALVSNDDLARIAREIGKELQKIEPETLKKEFGKIVLASRERGETATAPYAGESGEPGAPRPAGGKTGNLDQFTVDLTANAKAGKIDPVLGRDF